MGTVVLSFTLMVCVWAMFVAAVVITGRHDRRAAVPAPPEVIAPPTHVRKIAA